MKKQTKNQQQKKKIKWINPLRDRTRVVPFVVPNEQQRLSALGSLAGQKWKIKKTLQTIVQFFNPIKTPQPGDNLYQYEQDGQGFGLFASRARNHIDLKEQKIYIGTFYSKISEQTLKLIKSKAKAFFHGAKIKILKFPETDLSQFNPLQAPNGQKYYDAAKINPYFTKIIPKDAYSIAILTNLHIYNGDNLKQGLQQKWVFGLGSIKDRTSIISFEQIIVKGYNGTRIQNEKDQNEVNVQFLIKVVNHELCHTFGMRHCIYFQCLMNGTNQYKEAINKVQHLCPVCLRKLHLALDFQFQQRYRKLGDQKSIMLAQKLQQYFQKYKS